MLAYLLLIIYVEHISQSEAFLSKNSDNSKML